jgi:hypothetical protein
LLLIPSSYTRIICGYSHNSSAGRGADAVLKIREVLFLARNVLFEGSISIIFSENNGKLHENCVGRVFLLEVFIFKETKINC